MSPKVFISHASEDKDRFVMGFANKLYARGVEAWLDMWEILPGDSLVDKLFEEGIGQAQAVIVIVSEHSVNKPWVREELNAGMVRRINGKSLLIPVVIGDVADSQIPESLKSTVWERIGNLEDYDAEFERIVMAVYGHREKPALGPPPSYARSDIQRVPGLNRADSLILKICCENAAEADNPQYPMEQEALFKATGSEGIHPDQVAESFQILHSRGYMEARRTLDGGFSTLFVKERGFEEYARAYVPDYEALVRSVGLLILNQDEYRAEDIAASLHARIAVVEHVMQRLASKNYITVQRTCGGHSMVFGDISPELKRWLQST